MVVNGAQDFCHQEADVQPHIENYHYNDVIMSTIASQITSITIVYSTFIQTQIKGNIKAPRHWPLCGEFTGTGEFPAQMASYAENVSIWWRHHDAVSKHTRRHHGMEMLSALLVLWEGINQWFPLQKGTVIRSFGAFFVVSQIKQVNKHSSYRWFETPPRTYDFTVLWREGQLYNWVMIVANSRKSGITIRVNRYPLNSPG